MGGRPTASTRPTQRRARALELDRISQTWPAPLHWPWRTTLGVSARNAEGSVTNDLLIEFSCPDPWPPLRGVAGLRVGGGESRQA
jgi:hypothetical protein